MNSKFKIIETLSVIGFLVSIAYMAYTLFELPNRLVENTDTLNLENIGEVTSALLNVYIIIGITVALGVVSVVFLLVSRSNVKLSSTSNNLHTVDTTSASETSESNDEQKEETLNLASFVDVPQLLKNVSAKDDQYQRLLSAICEKVEASQGMVFELSKKANASILKPMASFAIIDLELKTREYEIGEGIIGQVAKDAKAIHLSDLDNDTLKIKSGLGSAPPTNIYISPILKSGKVTGVVEISSFKQLEKADLKKIDRAFHEFTEIKKEKKTQKANE